eukprot:260523_1
MFVVQKMKQQQINAAKQRELLLNQLDLQYASYINLLLQRKAFIASYIVKRYDELIHNINDKMYNYVNIQIQAHMRDLLSQIHHQNIKNTANTTLKSRISISKQPFMNNVQHNKQANKKSVYHEINSNVHNAFADDQQQHSNNNTFCNHMHHKSINMTPINTYSKSNIFVPIIDIPTIQNKHTITEKQSDIQSANMIPFNAAIIPTYPTAIHSQQNNDSNQLPIPDNIKQSTDVNNSKSANMFPSVNNINKPMLSNEIPTKNITAHSSVNHQQQNERTINSKSANKKQSDAQTIIYDSNKDNIAKTDEQVSVMKQDMQIHNLYISGLNLRCNECNELFYDHKTFVSHMKMKHNEFKPYKCIKCEYCNSTKQQLGNHIRSKHMFKCNRCKKKFYTNWDLMKHDAIYDKTKHIHPYQCIKCHGAFEQQKQLDTHIRNVHSRKVFKCKHCGYKCDKQHLLSKHIWNNHLKKQTLECKLCLKKFAKESELKCHMKTHKQSQ